MPATKRKPQSAPPKRRGRPPVSTAFPPEGAEFFTLAEVATLLRVHLDTVRRRVFGTEDKPPEIDHCRFGGQIRIAKSVLDAYIAASTVKAATVKVSAKARKRFES